VYIITRMVYFFVFFSRQLQAESNAAAHPPIAEESQSQSARKAAVSAAEAQQLADRRKASVIPEGKNEDGEDEDEDEDNAWLNDDEAVRTVFYMHAKNVCCFL
jgi:hypothetical protein